MLLKSPNFDAKRTIKLFALLTRIGQIILGIGMAAVLIGSSVFYYEAFHLPPQGAPEYADAALRLSTSNASTFLGNSEVITRFRSHTGALGTIARVYPTNPVFLITVETLAELANLFILFAIFSTVRALLVKIKNGSYFLGENAAMLRRIGRLILLLFAMTLLFALDLKLTELLFGLFMYVLADILESGATLQEEHDLTV